MEQAEMPLVVVYENGTKETIRLTMPAKIVITEYKNIIQCKDGKSYLFTQEGYYDGWETPMEQTQS